MPDIFTRIPRFDTHAVVARLPKSSAIGARGFGILANPCCTGSGALVAHGDASFTPGGQRRFAGDIITGVGVLAVARRVGTRACAGGAGTGAAITAVPSAILIIVGGIANPVSDSANGTGAGFVGKFLGKVGCGIEGDHPHIVLAGHQKHGAMFGRIYKMKI